MAGRCNAGGMIFLTENIPYTPKMLADELDFEENTVQLALNALEQLNMVVTDNGCFKIAGWEEYQNTDRLAEIREYNRIAKQKSREKQKLLQDVNDKSMTSQRCHETEEEKEEELESDLDIRDKEVKPSCQQVVDLYHSICKSFPSLRSVSETRKKAIRARLNTYTLEEFETVFRNAEDSSFLKGKNGTNWTATFDWMMKDANFSKVLEGNYADKGKKEKLPDWFKQKPSDMQKEAVKKLMEEDFSQEAEQLRRELQESFGGKR